VNARLHFRAKGHALGVTRVLIRLLNAEPMAAEMEPVRSELSLSSSTSVEESAAAEEEHDQDQDKKSVSVHTNLVSQRRHAGLFTNGQGNQRVARAALRAARRKPSTPIRRPLVARVSAVRFDTAALAGRY
jgi:hypothetical protein